ncbi:hypothetical protein [Campylobacter fetus]|uniref:hypothetical protein n=1 Tax=Campylobacter fetus TaxID=196 RepID=UPI000CFAE31D|nr:hypothetical protein [Campylobacter fetus]AVK80629.1 hypothetical protein C6B32_01860 [Campylobacter fetus subsp. testudinum]
MKTIFVANHTPSKELSSAIIPKNIALWAQIPQKGLVEHLEPLIKELADLCNADEEVQLVIAGEPRATCFLVRLFNENWERGNVSCYTTFSQRKSVDETMPDGSVKKTSIFEYMGLVPFI